MPRFEIDIENGDIVGDLPAELKGIIERSETMAYGNGVKNGRSTASEEAKKQIEDTLKAEKAKWDTQFQLDRERFGSADNENKLLKTQLLDVTRENQRTLQARENAHAAEILQRAESLKVRDEKIKGLVTKNLKALAAQAGARDESLSELEVILGASIRFDDSMEPFIVGPDGQQRLLHGKPMALDAYVKDYLDTHPHHRKPAQGRGGNAQGGQSYRSTGPVTSDVAVARIHDGDRSPDAINELFEATRKQRAH